MHELRELRRGGDLLVARLSRVPLVEASSNRSLASSPWAWAVLLAVYVALGLLVKSVVLNWIVGPLFPLVFLYLAPRWAGRTEQ